MSKVPKNLDIHELQKAVELSDELYQAVKATTVHSEVPYEFCSTGSSLLNWTWAPEEIIYA